ncbi:MAG TPA: hypothetical protein VIU11_21860 [Nakamurella sp.]
MNAVIFGATGMVGQAVLRTCLADPAVDRIVLVLRTPVPDTDPRIVQIIHRDFHDFSSLAGDLADLEVCLFCLGVTSAGKKEPEYRRVTFDITLTAARVLADVNPGMVFEYVSGQGTDSSERGRVMWARVKGETENAVIALPLRGYGIRPGFIRPMIGVRSKTRFYAAAYRALGWLYPMLARVAPNHVITSEELGRAMLAIAARRPDERIFDTASMKALIADDRPTR